MDVLLGQLIYTSFPEIGYRTLASQDVPEEIQQAFIKRVVPQSWDAFSPLNADYRAVYIHQVAPEHILFGWLYDDGPDDLGREHVPYFICYYLAEPLYPFLIENICTCLHQGPVALIDRHSLSAPLDNISVPDLWRYQGVRREVEIPWHVRQQLHIAFKQEILLDVFIPVNAQETLGELNKQVHLPELVAREKNADADSWQLSNNSLSLLGISIGAITALFVTVVTYGFFQTIMLPSTDSKVISEVSSVPQGLFSYWGPPIFIPLQSPTIVSAITQDQPQFQLRLVEPLARQPNSHTGIEMLLVGEFSFVQSSQSLQDAEFLEAKVRGFTLEQIPIAIDGITFYVNPQVSIPGLSLLQVKDIFTGKITNWRQVGGPDLPITPFYTFDQSGRTTSIFNEKVLQGEKLGTNVQEVNNPMESILKVTQAPGGIGYATVSEVAGQKTIYPLPLSQGNGQAFVSPYLPNQTAVNTTALLDGSYPLTTKLFVIIKKDGTLDEQAGLAYTNFLLSNKGQQLIERAGFVPIR